MNTLPAMLVTINAVLLLVALGAIYVGSWGVAVAFLGAGLACGVMGEAIDYTDRHYGRDDDV